MNCVFFFFFIEILTIFAYSLFKSDMYFVCVCVRLNSLRDVYINIKMYEGKRRVITIVVNLNKRSKNIVWPILQFWFISFLINFGIEDPPFLTFPSLLSTTEKVLRMRLSPPEAMEFREKILKNLSLDPVYCNCQKDSWGRSPRLSFSDSNPWDTFN